ncbi:uncharacterized protein DEA37_0007333 [Paragonimus westermani]|uniref:CUB domain-containing protein n=1 Tax=Paragonimus westermani TaxID=34504 RepID=A0A5J4NMI0_9TREM|nr:uncharacterized protein DEA37_0007333 [Paragonimus westermani]
MKISLSGYVFTNADRFHLHITCLITKTITQLQSSNVWYRVFDGEGCHSKVILYARGITTTVPLPVKSFGNQLTIMTVGAQLNLSFAEVGIADSTQQAVTNCNQIFTKQRNGIITSPNYPSSYPAFAFCNWKITMAPDDRILLALDSFQIEPPVNGAQKSDVLLIFDGPTCLDPTIAKISGNTPQQIASSTNQLSAMFISDDSLEERGFQAKFTAGTPHYTYQNVSCGGDFKGKTGTYSSAGISLNDLCIWRVTASKNRRILITMQSVTLSTPGTWYRIMDGDDCLSDLRYFARGPSTERPGPIKSSHSQLVVITVGGLLDFSYQAGM